MHGIRMNDGMVQLTPATSWHWEGPHDPSSWTVRVTAYGPSNSTTWNLPVASVVFVRWGSTPGQPYIGTRPLGWASTTARLQSETERSLTDEAQGSLAQLKADIARARSKALLLETVASAWGEGRGAAPQKDWISNRLGPNPLDSMATIRSDSFNVVLAACGTPPALFDDSDGTAQRE